MAVSRWTLSSTESVFQVMQMAASRSVVKVPFQEKAAIFGLLGTKEGAISQLSRCCKRPALCDWLSFLMAGGRCNLAWAGGGGRVQKAKAKQIGKLSQRRKKKTPSSKHGNLTVYSADFQHIISFFFFKLHCFHDIKMCFFM